MVTLKNKGFTLVELIAVIIVLSLLMTLVAPTVLRSKDNALNALSKEQEKGIRESAKMVGIDLDDYHTDIYNCKEASWIEDKCHKDVNGDWNNVELTLDDLSDHGYWQDLKGHCKGGVVLSKDSRGNYQVEFRDVKCTNNN